jgi:hypothetical protein
VSDVRSAALLVRIWLEEDDSFRARLTAVGAPSADGWDTGTTVALGSSPEEVLQAVSSWLQGHLGTPGAAGSGVQGP